MFSIYQNDASCSSAMDFTSILLREYVIKCPSKKTNRTPRVIGVFWSYK